jgi:predicted SprT family Zn-dependent metalloprotease
MILLTVRGFAEAHAIALPTTIAESVLRLPVTFNGRLRSRAGQARFRYGLPHSIELHPKLRDAEPDELRETFLHELAHVLAGARAGHGPTWRVIARGLGSTGERCHSIDAVTSTLPIVGTCGKCGAVAARKARMPRAIVTRRGVPVGVRTWRHRGCGGPITFRRVEVK